MRSVSHGGVFFIASANQYYRWNAALAIASFLDSNRYLYVDRNVLELGAGGGLPSIVTVKNGARKVGHLMIRGDR